MEGTELGRTLATRGGSIIVGVDETEQNQNSSLDKQNIVDNIETEPQFIDIEVTGGTVNENTAKEDQVDELVDDDPTCGWGSWRPTCVQVLNSPKGFCLFLCLFAMVQGMTVNGLVYVDTTTLEKRFDLPSVRSGSISSCYDFSVTLVVIFVTYFGEKQHKPKLLGIGAIIFGIGCYTFSLPHFTTGYYHNGGDSGSGVGPANITTCDANRSIPLCVVDDNGKKTSLSSYYWVFVFAQVLHGIGASPLYTLGVTYMDDNVTPKLIAMYIGIFNAISILGPALGYVLGGLYLTIYTDVRVDPADHGISRASPIWVGAWWIGFLVSGSCCLLVSFPLFGYPRALPGAQLIAKERALKNNDEDDMMTRASYGGASIKDFPAAVWNLVKNVSYMMLNLSTCSEWFILAAMAVFGPKYMESQFNISPSVAAGICGAVVILSGVGGTLIGGWVVKRFKLSVKAMLQFVLATLSVSALLLICFFIYCENVKFAGVTTQYSDKSLSYPKDIESNISASCNVDCRCAQAYDPLCGIDDVMYYTGCYAGCASSKENENGIREYFDCACMNFTKESASEPMGTAVRCDIDCPLIPLFLVLLFFQMLSTFMAIVPGTTAVLRIVDHDQRAFGLGIQSVMYRLLGTVPGPIIFGAIIDGQCLLWEKECGGSNGTCWLYDNESFSRYTLLMAGILKIISLISVAGSIATLGSRGAESSAEPSTTNGENANFGDNQAVSVVSYRHFDTLSSPDMDALSN